MSIRVVGLDLSLTGTGIATTSASGMETRTIESAGKKTDDWETRYWRATEIVQGVIGFTTYPPHPDLVVIEGPAHAAQSTSAHERAGLWWRVYDRLAVRGIPVLVVAPTQLKKYATGSGNAPKDQVIIEVVRRYPEIQVKDNNQADAVVLAAIGLRMLGHPIEESLPKVNLAALNKVVLPKSVVAV